MRSRKDEWRCWRGLEINASVATARSDHHSHDVKYTIAFKFISIDKP